MQTLGWWTRPIPFLERCRARYGRRFTVRLVGAVPRVMLSDPEDVRELFLAPPDVVHPGEGGRLLEPVVGRSSLVLLDEDDHLAQRKLMLPAFHGDRMRRLHDLVADVAERAVATWPRDRPIELHPRLQALALEVMLRAVLGLDPGERLDALRERLIRILDLANRPAVVMPSLQRDLGGRGPWPRFLALREETDAQLFGLIAERRRAGADGDDVMAMLLAARDEDGNAMSDRELRDELMTLLVAGHETTASALAWAFARLCREPAVVERLTDEIRRGDGTAYLTATVQETLRHRPVLPNAAPRYVKEPVRIGGWTYPRDVRLAADAYSLHHDPAVYREPYAFRPERFLDEQPGTYTWIPFGGGRRRCIGASLATLEMSVVIRTVLAGDDVRPAGNGVETARRRSVTITPRSGARVVLRPRLTASIESV